MLRNVNGRSLRLKIARSIQSGTKYSYCVTSSPQVNACLCVVYVSTFALISPLGAGIGIALSESDNLESSLQSNVVTVLQGLATGTLLYVVFFEVIEKERTKGTNGILQVSAPVSD